MIRGAALILLITALAGADHLPPELLFPRPVEESDSPRVTLSSEQILFDRSLTSINNAVYHPVFGPYKMEQGVGYELRRDKLQNLKQYINIAGSLERTLTKYPSITPGFDWTPVTQLYTSQNGVNSLMTLDAGPTFRTGVKGVDLFLRAGASGRRLDSLKSWRDQGFHRSSVGAYGAFSMGSMEQPILNLPLYFFTQGITRSIENSSMVSLFGNALSAFTIAPEDSLFLFTDGSLFNGKEGYLEESADSRSILFSSTPWRIQQDMRFMAGFKARPRHIFTPSLYYSWQNSQLAFPTDDRKRDERTVRHSLSAALSTDSSMNLFYGGQISFDWRDHDKLFGKSFSENANEGNIDSLNLNLWDHSSFNPRIMHQLTLRLPHSARLSYNYSLSRVLTEYPNYYMNKTQKVINNDDNDRLNLLHRISLSRLSDSPLNGEIFGEISEYTLVFLRKAKSSSNRTDQGQRLGAIVEWTPVERLTLSESITAEAKMGSFHFVEFHQDPLERPRYSRALSSNLTGFLSLSPVFGLKGMWNTKYSDYGYWYGNEYMDTILALDDNARTDYYAITGKAIYYTLDFSLQAQFDNLVAELGNAFTDINDQYFQNGKYVVMNDEGYTTKPYSSVTLSLGGNLNLSAYVSHTFVVGQRSSGYWDFRMQMEGRL